MVRIEHLTDRFIIRLILAASLGIFVILIDLGGGFNQLENLLYDTRAWITAHRFQASDDIVVIEIDDESIRQLEDSVGNWPWPRSIFAAVVHFLEPAEVVAFDILFSESDKEFLIGDRELVQEVRAHGRVVSCVFMDARPMESQAFSKRSQAAAMLAPATSELHAYSGALLPMEELLDASFRIGHGNCRPDSDGVLRSYQAKAAWANYEIPSLALAMMMGPAKINYSADGSFRWVPYKMVNKKPGYKTYRITDVLKAWHAYNKGETSSILPDHFEGKKVLIGSTAEGLQIDRQNISTTPLVPGVFIHAMALDNMINGHQYLKTPHWMSWCLIMIWSLIPACLRVSEKGVHYTLKSATVGISYSILCVAFSFMALLMIPMAAPLVGFLASFLLFSSLYWLKEQARARNLEALENAKQEFTDMLVHDLKGRIASMRLSMDLLENKEGEVASRNQRLLAILKQSGDKLLGQVLALLDIRKIEEGKLLLNKTSCYPEILLQEIADEMSEAATHNDLTFLIESDSNENSLRVDQEITKRVLLNLVWNAVKYATPSSTILLKAYQKGDEWVLQVANEGEPIPEDRQDVLFKPFISVGREGKDRLNAVGTGLGLTFCQLALDAHGGRMELESPWKEKNNGASFFAIFPNTAET